MAEYPKYRNCVPWAALIPFLERWEKTMRARFEQPPAFGARAQGYNPLWDLSEELYGDRYYISRTLHHVKNGNHHEALDFDKADKLVLEILGPHGWRIPELRELWESIELVEDENKQLTQSRVFITSRDCVICGTSFDVSTRYPRKMTCSDACADARSRKSNRQKQTLVPPEMAEAMA